jgi:hypothetical protein
VLPLGVRHTAIPDVAGAHIHLKWIAGNTSFCIYLLLLYKTICLSWMQQVVERTSALHYCYNKSLIVTKTCMHTPGVIWIVEMHLLQTHLSERQNTRSRTASLYTCISYHDRWHQNLNPCHLSKQYSWTATGKYRFKSWYPFDEDPSLENPRPAIVKLIPRSVNPSWPIVQVTAQLSTISPIEKQRHTNEILAS